MLLVPCAHASRSLIARGGGWPSTLRGPPKEGGAYRNSFLVKSSLRPRDGRPLRNCRVRLRRRPLVKPRRIWIRQSPWRQSDLRRRAPLRTLPWTNRGCLLGQTHCSGKLILAARARCLNTLLSVAARALPLCWPRLTTRTCCNRGAHAESPAILRRRANYMNGRRQAGLRTRRGGAKLLNRGRLINRPAPGSHVV